MQSVCLGILLGGGARSLDAWSHLTMEEPVVTESCFHMQMRCSPEYPELPEVKYFLRQLCIHLRQSAVSNPNKVLI